MRFLFCLQIALIILLNDINAQSYSVFDKKYGLDPTLFNGRVYRFHVNGRLLGSQFINSPDFSTGSVKIKNNTYKDLLLNYDIYNQQLVYQFTNESAGLNRIMISDAWLESFTLENSYFEVHKVNDVPKIYKVLGEKPYQVMYQFFKELKVDNQVGSTSRRFSSPIRTSYLSHEGTMDKYFNNRSFIKLFSKEKQPPLRKYMREHHINMKRSADPEILQLLLFINSNL